jgi:phosphate/sulfate permease
LILTVFLWIFVAIVVVFVDPEEIADTFITGGYLIFTVPLSLAIWFSTSLLFGNSLIGAILSLGMIVSVYLRLIKIGSWWILLPWWGVVLCTAVFFLYKGKVDKPVDD